VAKDCGRQRLFIGGTPTAAASFQSITLQVEPLKTYPSFNRWRDRPDLVQRERVGKLTHQKSWTCQRCKPELRIVAVYSDELTCSKRDQPKITPSMAVPVPFLPLRAPAATPSFYSNGGRRPPRLRDSLFACTFCRRGAESYPVRRLPDSTVDSIVVSANHYLCSQSWRGRYFVKARGEGGATTN
jgi:hypothetical protein